MALQIKKATKTQARLRMALIGPSGSGKTYSALRIATEYGGKILLVDTERGSASKYAGVFDFDVIEMDTFHPQQYIEAIKMAQGYDWLIIDSLSHAWMGKDGALELVDKAAKRTQSGNSFGAWREVTPLHNALVDAILQCSCHLIATMRAKTEYSMEKDEKTGRTAVRKVGLAPVQRDGLEYEFDVVADMSIENDLMVTKSRCPELHGAVINKPGKDVADRLKIWLTDGAPAPKPEPDYDNPQTQAKPVQKTEPPKCHDCEGDITHHKLKSGQELSAAQIMQASNEQFGVSLCWDCSKKRKNGNGKPETESKEKKKAVDPVMARLCILCNEVFDDESLMRAWFGAEYGVEHRTELTQAQRMDAITKLTEMVEEEAQQTL